MFNIKKFVQFFIMIAVFLFVAQQGFCEDLESLDGEHFIVIYAKGEDRQWVQRVLLKAEEYYRKISQAVGYQGISSFWTWDQRVKIIVYPDKISFTKATGQPIWAIGGMKRDADVLATKRIVSYKQEDKFIENVLPHEISHLVLHDFVKDRRRIPIWFDEGVAQLFEEGKVGQANQYLRKYLKHSDSISFDEFSSFNVRYEVNPMKVSLFYIQSVSVVDFMIKKYGSSKFSQLCRYLSQGEDFSNALRKTYLGTIETMTEMEKKWLRYMD